MANKCAYCRGLNTQPLLDNYACLDCGGYTSFDGKRAKNPTGKGITTRENVSVAGKTRLSRR